MNGYAIISFPEGVGENKEDFREGLSLIRAGLKDAER